MLQLSQSLIGRQIMSLRTGQPVATSTAAIINPNNLKVEGFYCLDNHDKKKQLVLLYQDIRDIIPQGLVVDDHDVLAEPQELIRLKDIMSINFQLIGKAVFSTDKRRVGKVNDYAVETTTLFIQKIYVGQPLIKVFASGSLSVDRTQIVEITNRKIVIQDPLQPTKALAGATMPAG